MLPLQGVLGVEGQLNSRASPFADECLPFRQGADFLFLRMLRMENDSRGRRWPIRRLAFPAVVDNLLCGSLLTGLKVVSGSLFGAMSFCVSNL